MADDIKAGDGATTPPSGTDFTPALPLKGTGATFESADTDEGDIGGRRDTPSGTAEKERLVDEITGATEAFREQAQRFTRQAQDRVRTYAEDGKARATGALDEVSRVINDAADTVDEKIGTQYGRYARSAADYVDGLARSIDAKQVDDILDDVRGFVQKSPAVALGTAAALGFVLARVLRSGIDAGRADV